MPSKLVVGVEAMSLRLHFGRDRSEGFWQWNLHILFAGFGRFDCCVEFGNQPVDGALNDGFW